MLLADHATTLVNTSEDGVFFHVSSPILHKKVLVDEELSVATIDTYPCGSSESSSKSLPDSWKTTGTKSFLRNAPLLVCDPDKDDGHPIEHAAQKLGEILSRSRQHLPGMSQYASNHVMVNHERIKRCSAPLIRLSELDEIARQQAAAMAVEDRLFHSDPARVRAAFHRPARRMGENVAKGISIREIHRAMMETSVSDRNNIMDRRYTHMGMGTAKCDGQLYLCQIFRG